MVIYWIAHVCKPQGGVMHSVYIYAVLEEPLAISNHFLRTCFEAGTINHRHSAPPVSLRHADQLDQSALRKKKTFSEQLANEVAPFNVDLWDYLSQ